MSAWVQAYEALSEEQKVNVQRWLHLNKFIARTLKIPEQEWFEGYLGDAMAHPFDYGFMALAIPELLTPIGAPGQGESFTKTLDPGELAGPKVPIGAQNNLGRLSPALQQALASMLEKGEPEELRVVAADVAQLQKIFPGAKDLARLKRPDFRRVLLKRDVVSEDMVIALDDNGPELMRTNVMEFSAVMARRTQ